jgi:hypothetical protein
MEAPRAIFLFALFFPRNITFERIASIGIFNGSNINGSQGFTKALCSVLYDCAGEIKPVRWACYSVKLQVDGHLRRASDNDLARVV